jgi:hypothetical protein
MKKLLIIAAAALLAAACAKTYEVKETTPPAIGFGTWAETLTKAITDHRTAGTSTFGVGDSFAVYGYKEVTSPASKTTVFDDVAVEMTAAGVPGTWTYSPTRYWDQNTDQYVFYAVSPSSVGTGGTVDPQTGEITSASIVFSGKNNDILVADKETVLKAAYGNQVQLDFNHAASLVDFKVAKASNLHDATVKVTAFTLANIQTTGVMSVNDAYNATVYGGTAGPVVTWSSTATGTYGPTSGVNSVTLPLEIAEDDVFPVPAEPGDGKSTFIINNLVVKPQTFAEPTGAEKADPASAATAQKLTITYTIEVTGGGTNTYTSTLFLYDFDVINDKDQGDTPVGSWATGKHYIFYITLDSTPIVFGAKINDWGTVSTGYHYLVN